MFKKLFSFFQKKSSTDNFKKDTEIYNIHDVKKAAEKISSDKNNDLIQYLHIINHGDYKPEFIMDIAEIIAKLHETKRILEQIHERTVNSQNNSNIQNQITNNDLSDDFQRNDDIDQKIVFIFEAIINLECKKMQFQRGKILSKYINIENAMINLVLEETEILQTINQLFQLFESTEQFLSQILQSANEYKAKNNDEMAKLCLKLYIDINYEEVLTVGNICFFNNWLVEVKIMNALIKLRDVPSFSAPKNLDDFSFQVFQKLSKLHIKSENIQQFKDTADEINTISTEIENQVSEICQKERMCESPNDENKKRRLLLIKEKLDIVKILVEDVESDLRNKIEKVHDDN